VCEHHLDGTRAGYVLSKLVIDAELAVVGAPGRVERGDVDDPQPRRDLSNRAPGTRLAAWQGSRGHRHPGGAGWVRAARRSSRRWPRQRSASSPGLPTATRDANDERPVLRYPPRAPTAATAGWRESLTPPRFGAKPGNPARTTCLCPSKRVTREPILQSSADRFVASRLDLAPSEPCPTRRSSRS
jgi:hypothetical protein